ncbi:methyltransferase domain-containing protein [Methanothermococcus sp. SCGC AD-155-C09]|nr:methyltransferase domain-containing protein [Methanothermococcus sp. SCGC AD-155-C09]
MDRIKCPFCESEDLRFKRNIVSPLNNKKYKHWFCKDCHLEFFTPLIFEKEVYIDEIDSSYKEFHKGNRAIPDWTDETIKILKNNFKIKDLSNKKILEVGAGDCINFVVFKKEFNISKENYYAIELDYKSVETCKKRGVVNIINEFFDEKILDKIKDKFDIILCLEVLEHQIKPKEFLDVCFKLLKEDGILIISVPNRDRFLIRFREISSSDIPPHHFLRFNKKFFIRNFKNKLVYIGCFNPDKYFYKSCKIVSKILFKNENLWPLSIPAVIFLIIMNKISPPSLLVILKK